MQSFSENFSVMACTLFFKMRERERLLFFYQSPFPLKSENCTTPQTPTQPPCPPSLPNFSLCTTSPPVKNQIFQWTLLIKLKVTKFIVKLSQFKCLVNSDKYIFVYNFFVFKCFRFCFNFYAKNGPPAERRGGGSTLS